MVATWARSRLAGRAGGSPVLTLLPYLLLAVLAAITVPIAHSNGRSPLVELVLAAVLAGWMLGLFTLHPGWRDRPVVMAVFVAGVAALTMVLVLRAPWFGFFAPAGYVYAYRLVRWPGQLAAVAAIAVVAGTAQAYAVPRDDAAGIATYAAILVANALPMCGYAWLRQNLDRQDRQRRQALAEVSAANERLAASLADNAALHRQLLDQAHQAGVAAERQRLAREIHDTMAQGLTGIVTQLQAAEQAADDPGRWRRHFAAATALARESLTEARRSVHELRPEPLETGRLSEALAEVARRWSARSGIDAQATTTGTVRPMATDAEVALLRVAQEALANVAKHAGAGRVGVTLSYLAHEVALDVRDDGRGFDPAAPAARRSDGGFGLIAMRQRIEALAGGLTVESEPGLGTTVSARIPTPEADA
ncbi:histidine kinase [Actinocatenispora thailandica]|uniref:Oxygen sensor histidine kinase NreB n=1 Tax=Actinocatenispora thailandica TaxID=227318 RepID=A0A7R7HWR3_9ACTN|nr:sensor histidine kinase [Actinocatenispora thailandica]BCJ35163.1 histidine kinase [Actinocatenispora thailandica]